MSADTRHNSFLEGSLSVPIARNSEVTACCQIERVVAWSTCGITP